MRPGVFATVLVALWAAPALAQADEITGRYELKQAEGGFIRLDTKTGSVSHCSKQGSGWECTPVADDRQALRDEIARLDDENRELRQRIARLEDRRASRDEPKTRQDDDVLRLPSDQDIDKIMTFFEKMMRRFMDFARSLKEPAGQET